MSWHPEMDGRRRRRRRGGRVVALVFGVLMVAVIAVLAFGFLYGRRQLDPPEPGSPRQVVVTIHDGESLDEVVGALEQNHLIRSRFWFTLYARVENLGGNLRSGRHTLNPGMGASAVVSTLEAQPDVRTSRLVLAEGLTAAQMADRIQAANLGISAAQYLDEVRHGSFSASFLSGRPPGASLEGFLFPDTYDVPEGTTAHQLVQMQLDAFASTAAPLLVSHSSPAVSAYQVLVLGSIVEREAQLADDRPLVASVLVNRLRNGTPLQVDASVSYGVGRTSGEPTKAELQQDTPYNTYLHPGLPPTPISNPGAAAIQAASRPATSDYLYYVSDGCGRNHYARTAAEHDSNVQQYVGKPCS